MPTSFSLFFPLLLVLYEITTYLSNDMYLPALPQMMHDLQLNAQQAQLTLTMWFLGQASMPLLMGVLADRYGRRPILIGGGIIYILATLLCAMAMNSHLLLIGRVLEGAMVASMLVAGYACIHELYQQKEAIRILALMGSISVLAPAFGPLLGSFVLYFSNWRGIFWFIALLASLIVLCLYQWMPETHPPEKQIPLPFSLLFKQYIRILTNLKFMGFMFILGLIFGGWITWITAGPLLIINNFHYSAISFGIIQAFIFLAYIIASHQIKFWLNRLDVSKLIRLGLSITLIGGLLTYVLAYYFNHTLYPFLGAMLFYSYGSALCFSSLNRTIIESSQEPMGIRVALFTVFVSGFAALGSAISSLFFNGTITSLAFLIATAITLACLIYFLFNISIFH
jgi:DHA1 family multidrug/chloramphenicol efflux transport protein-like MFS transporter